MVKWRGREKSTNYEDRRGAIGGAGLSGIAIMALRFVLTRWGLGGVAFLVAGFFALSAVGVNPLVLLSGGSGGSGGAPSAADQEASDFSLVILKETEAAWTNEFAKAGYQYQPTSIVFYTGGTQTGCGYGQAAAGPFYCPADQKVYLDTSFFNELKSRFHAGGDFANAYVIAHEVGHHVQLLTGVAEKVRQAQARTNEAGRNRLQVMMELQADCYAGVWAHDANRENILEPGDIEEGLRAASAIGDDTLQRNAGRRVTPESFTHGSSDQRVRWFTTGYKTGDVDQCDTFGATEL